MILRKLRFGRGLVLLVAFATSAAVLPGYSQSLKDEQSNNQEKSKPHLRDLEGTWRVQVTLRNCQTGAGLRTFPALLTFANGGIFTETTTGIPPSQRSPGHGFWRNKHENSFLGVSEAFLFSPAEIWTGTQRLTQQIEVERNTDEFSSTASIEVFDVSGLLLTKGCATATGRRFE